jgi:uncharacterized repeat protein (TIGR03803 family)
MGRARLGWWKTARAVCVLCALTAIASPAQVFKTLVTFNGTNGGVPFLMSLVQGTNGDLYGTTQYGGANDQGTVFEITPSGTLRTLYSFCAQTNCADGGYPSAGLVLGTDGSFYGTTSGSGGNCGTVFRMTSGGALTTLHRFDCTDGSGPQCALVQATDGNFYGTTYYGGASSSCVGGCGTAFKITPQGALTTLHSFDSTDGAYPSAGLVQATDGSLYGTTSAGGDTPCVLGLGCGTVFKITSAGELTTLHRFADDANLVDGGNPGGALVQASDGKLYGTASHGGLYGFGTVFEITPGGTLTTLHSFDSTDGAYPTAGLIQATDGNLYGTTDGGGTNSVCGTIGCGTVFKITPGGALTTLHDFCAQTDCTDGVDPFGGLVQATDGTFYGTTNGNPEPGTVFSLANGLGPFVATVPSAGKTGKAVMILGTNLKGATSVSFNGTAATFTVVSSTLITTTVPSGAATGTIEVVVPGGALSSNAPFRVIN